MRIPAIGAASASPTVPAVAAAVATSRAATDVRRYCRVSYAT